MRRPNPAIPITSSVTCGPATVRAVSADVQRRWTSSALRETESRPAQTHGYGEVRDVRDLDYLSIAPHVLEHVVEHVDGLVPDEPVVLLLHVHRMPIMHWASALQKGERARLGRHAYVPLRKQERRSSAGASTHRPPSPGCSSRTSPRGCMTTSASGSAHERLLFPIRGPDCSVSCRVLASGGTVPASRRGT